MKDRIWRASIFLAAALPAAAQDDGKSSEGPTLIARLSFWSAALDGRIRVDEDHVEWFPFLTPITTVTDVKGSGIHLGDDSDLDLRALIPVFEVEIAGMSELYSSGRDTCAWQGGLRLTYWGHEWSGAGTLGEGEAYDGTSFPRGTRAECRLRYDLAGLDYVMRAWIPKVPLVLTTDLGLRVVRSEFEMEGASGGEEERFDGLLFGAALRADWRPTRHLVVAGGLGAYGLFGVPLAEGSLSVGAEWGRARLDVGYRQLWVDGGSQHEEFRLRLGGLSAGLSIRF